MEKNGVIRIGQHSTLSIIHYGENWKNLTRQGKAVQDGKLEKEDNASLRMKGTFPVFQGTFQLKETMSPVGKDTVRLHCLLESGAPIPTRQLALLISMDPQLAQMRPLKRNGKPFGFREVLDEKRWNLSLSKTKSLEIPLENGTLVLEGNLSGNMVDGREKTELYKAYDKVCAEFALPILETHLPDSKRFRKETAAERKAVFRSTAFPADKILVRGSNLDKLVDEILGIIKN